MGIIREPLYLFSYYFSLPEGNFHVYSSVTRAATLFELRQISHLRILMSKHYVSHHRRLDHLGDRHFTAEVGLGIPSRSPILFNIELTDTDESDGESIESDESEVIDEVLPGVEYSLGARSRVGFVVGNAVGTNSIPYSFRSPAWPL
jgi:hypothetical protein